MGPQPDKGRHVALEEGHGAAVAGSGADQVQRAAKLSRTGVHRPGLEHVQWLRHRGGDRALQAVIKGQSSH